MNISLAWGPTGAAALAPHAGIAVVVDVLSFSTTVTVAADLGIDVLPHRWGVETAAAYAREAAAALAVSRSGAGTGDVSLSPASFRAVAGLTRVVLPSPNGSTICAVLAEGGAEVVVASLRNRWAVADYLAARDADVLLVPAGERWPDGSLRPAIEDLWGAGGVAAALQEAGAHLSDEGQAAAAAYRLVERRVEAALRACASGVELIDSGYASDVTIAAELDASACVPVLVGNRLTALHPGT
ncbi:MAG: 2-phosphosulfolactate phosphatase [Actinomycetota bacterium]|nr:2-phosphosulfolactate phosphatase [Actinomycetota bacterium]